MLAVEVEAVDGAGGEGDVCVSAETKRFTGALVVVVAGVDGQMFLLVSSFDVISILRQLFAKSNDSSAEEVGVMQMRKRIRAFGFALDFEMSFEMIPFLVKFEFGLLKDSK